MGYRDYDDEDRDTDDPERMWARIRLICQYILCAFGAVVLAIGLVIWLAGHALSSLAQVGEPEHQSVPAHVACQNMGSFAWAIAMPRDQKAGGGSAENVIAFVRGNFGQHPGVVAILEAEVRQVWAERLPPDEAAESAFERCMDLLGQEHSLFAQPQNCEKQPLGCASVLLYALKRLDLEQNRNHFERLRVESDDCRLLGFSRRGGSKRHDYLSARRHHAGRHRRSRISAPDR